MLSRLRSIIAYRRFQSRVRKARDAARRSHRATRQINAAQTERIHDALAGGKFNPKGT